MPDTSQAGTLSVACFAVDNAGLRVDQTVPYTVTAPPPPVAGCPARTCKVELEGRISTGGTGGNRPELEASFEAEGTRLSGKLELREGRGRNERRVLAAGRPTSLSVTEKQAVVTGNASYNGVPGTYALTVDKTSGGATVQLVFRKDGADVATWTGKLTGEVKIKTSNRGS